MQDIKSEFLKRIAGKRVALVGIGNIEKGDDGIGIHLVRRLKGRLKNTAIFDCGVAPENYLGPIAKSNPQAVVMVDAADLGAEPGHVHIIDEKDVSDIGLSTHDISLKLFIAYLKNNVRNIDIFLIGVQPKNTNLGDTLSEDLSMLLQELEDMFLEALS